jgi:hypothetical protein
LEDLDTVIAALEGCDLDGHTKIVLQAVMHECCDLKQEINAQRKESRESDTKIYALLKKQDEDINELKKAQAEVSGSTKTWSDIKTAGIMLSCALIGAGASLLSRLI